MKLGVHFLNQDYAEFVEAVVQAEAAGFDMVWLIDSQSLWQDMTVYLAGGLAATERVVFGTAVTNPVTRHVTVLGSMFATLDELHPGRVILGIGRGDSAVRSMGMRPASTKQLAETVPVLRELMAGRTVELNGAEVSFPWRSGNGALPVMMGATGPKNLRSAGGLADRVMLQVGVHPESVAWAIAEVRAGAGEAGRDPDEVKISVLCACRISDDQQAAWEACRWSPVSAANHIAEAVRHNPDHAWPEPMLGLVRAREEFMRSREAYDYSKHLDTEADQMSFATEQHIDDFAIAGPAAKCLEKIRALGEVGVDEVSIAHWNGEFEQISRVGSEIIPQLAASSAR